MSAINPLQMHRATWQAETSATAPGRGSDDALVRRPTQGAQDITGQILERASTLELIFALQVFGREQNKTDSENAILSKKASMDDALRQEREAIKKAQEEREDQGKWGGLKGKLSTIATGAMVAASVASVVLSSGVSAPLAVALVGMAISMAAKPVGEAVGSKKLEIGMQIGGAVLSLAGGGAGAVSAGSAATSSAASTASATGSAVSAGASTGASAGAASGATQAMSTASRVASTIKQ
ncbi:MAG: hypothetical protein EOO70_04130, partial [Myxococcaceae bacterium]